MVPAQVGAEVESCEDAENHQGDNLLDHFELHGREAAIAKAVGWYLKAVLEEGDAPADDDHLPKRLRLVFQVAVPGEGHEDVGEDEQNDGPHS